MITDHRSRYLRFTQRTTAQVDIRSVYYDESKISVAAQEGIRKYRATVCDGDMKSTFVHV